MVVGIRLAEAAGKFANGAHEPVLYLFQKQNRELPFANSVRASRVKDYVRSWILDNRNFRVVGVKLALWFGKSGNW